MIGLYENFTRSRHLSQYFLSYPQS